MLKKIVLQIAFLFTAIFAGAQIPDLIPSGETEPIELTPLNIIIYFVLPIVIFLIYFWYRKSKRKNKNKPGNS
jgi:membrane protein DedA with SNARE-associated domain